MQQGEGDHGHMFMDRNKICGKGIINEETIVVYTRDMWKV